MGLLAAWAVGCKGRPQGFEQFVPKPEAARRALVAAMDAWRAGVPPGKVDGVSPSVVVVDSHRRPGQSLGRYEVLGEVAEENVRTFAVRVHLENPEEQAVVRYNLFGLDPIWVFRREDYDMISHWEHAMGDGEA
jgi:hypothetical protein